MSPIFIFILGAVVVVLVGAFVLDVRRRRFDDDASADPHRYEQREREGKEFRQGGPGGSVNPSDPGIGGM